ncbi:MAG: arylsulfatase [Sporocytophaga sp.]|uniref:arylsulfatase n=1 Tax=Sporocytophaga sp. TaxID=2231183 RepID=UPI001B1CCBBB|nr:arylsulfatase [Sporocytophaga sp.]MBO9703155.1 arylsulfatase [Sporocytophaga sp.]
MSTSSRLVSLLLLLFCTAVKFPEKIDPEARKDSRPNIIIILADDMGFSDLGCYGSEIPTPNLDKLAYEGLRLTNFYNAGRCCPSRASILTGLYPHQAGIGDMLQNKGSYAYQGFLSDSCVTIAQLLKQAGYHTITSGKWHVGTSPSALAPNRGFDKSFCMLNNGSSYFKNGPLYNDGRTVTFMQNGRVINRDTNYYLTQNITDFVLSAIEEQKNNKNPFFLYLTYTAPHWPIQALEEDIRLFRGKYLIGWDSIREHRFKKQIKEKIFDKETKLSSRYYKVPQWNNIHENDKNLWDLRMSIYAAMIYRMDKGIGEILQKLKKTGEDKNTLIIFLSDNGGSGDEVQKDNLVIQRNGTPGTGDYIDSYQKNWGNASNTPFSMFKKNMHEGGISTPFIAYFPGVIKPGQINHSTGHIINILPTCLELAKAKYPQTFNGNHLKQPEGKSMINIFKGAKSGNDTLYWEHEGNKAIRVKNWKLVYELEQNEWQLYDLQSDRSETRNLVNNYPDKVQQLIAAHDKWCSKIGVIDWSTIK